MTGCEPILDLISLRLDGPLDPQDQKALDDHLAHCPSCRAISEELHGLHGAVTGIGETTPPEGFAQEVLRRIAAEGEQGDRVETKTVPLFRRWQVMRLAGLAACAVLMVGAARFFLADGAWTGSAAPSAGAPAPAAAEPASSAPEVGLSQFRADGANGIDGSAQDAILDASPRSAQSKEEGAGIDYVMLATDALGEEPNRLLVLYVIPAEEMEWVPLTQSVSLCTVEPERIDALILELREEDRILLTTDSGGPEVVLLAT